uniref:Uncharacterized protein n=1 Tax=Ascaris lumbricoides TaxID=6252 RepID=A0A0M3HJ05_ASCLU
MFTSGITAWRTSEGIGNLSSTFRHSWPEASPEV